MSKEILIQTQKGERLVAIVDKGRLDDFHIELDRYQSLLGNIYKGKVESILPSINAAFVNIGQARNGFLYLTDVVVNPLVADEVTPKQSLLNKIFKIPEKEDNNKDASKEESTTTSTTTTAPTATPPATAPKAATKPPVTKTARKDRRPRRKSNEVPLTVGQEILVQVVKDPFGEKGARLTTHITLPGRFVVYMPFDRQTGISRKIDKVEERRRLKDVIKSFAFAKTGGFIIRTASLKQGKRELVRDAKFLYQMWVKIHKKSEQESAPALIYEEGELTWKIVRDYLTDRVDKLIIDNEEEFQKIRKFVNTLIGRSMVNKIHHYKGKKALFDFKNISKELNTIYDTNVHVKTGAYIVIEPTEGLIVVDVNSGKFKVKASPGDAAFMVNMEVIPEIARQLRLRDLGGIIVIDFIDMVKEEHKRKVVDALSRALARDHAKTEVNRISSLGLVEMTRARTGKTIESLSFGKCPYCDGRGRVKIS